VILLDGYDPNDPATRANFGLIWIQGKGSNMPAHQMWSHGSGDRRGEFSRGLAEITARDPHVEQNGGVVVLSG
jgi:hypothetical protein